MRWHDGRKERSKRRNERRRAKKEAQREWHDVFAWWPVSIDGKVYWLETVRRRIEHMRLFVVDGSPSWIGECRYYEPSLKRQKRVEL